MGWGGVGKSACLLPLSLSPPYNSDAGAAVQVALQEGEIDWEKEISVWAARVL